jgi:hypothetical protein
MPQHGTAQHAMDFSPEMTKLADAFLGLQHEVATSNSALLNSKKQVGVLMQRVQQLEVRNGDREVCTGTLKPGSLNLTRACVRIESMGELKILSGQAPPQLPGQTYVLATQDLLSVLLCSGGVQGCSR